MSNYLNNSIILIATQLDSGSTNQIYICPDGNKTLPHLKLDFFSFGIYDFIIETKNEDFNARMQINVWMDLTQFYVTSLVINWVYTKMDLSQQDISGYDCGVDFWQVSLESVDSSLY